MKINVALVITRDLPLDAGIPASSHPDSAMIVFGESCYWEIPASHHDALKIAEAANELAGQELDAIAIVGGKAIAARAVGGEAMLLAGGTRFYTRTSARSA